MSKSLVVATEVQKAVFEQVLLTEFSSGFWKNTRPADHADYWKGVEVLVGTTLGPSGFEVPRNYNFVNPVFFTKAQDSLMAVAKSVNADITVKQLKKQLISLNRIIGARLKEVNGQISKLSRGRKSVESTEPQTVKKTSSNSVRKMRVQIVDQESTETA